MSNQRKSLRSDEAPLAAMRLLRRREHSARELQRKLRARGLEAAAAERVVDDLAERGWQSDRRFVEQALRQRLHQHFGRRRIEAELRVAGCDDALVQELLEAEAVDWDAQAQQAWRRRFCSPPTDAKSLQQQHRYLAYRGFDNAQIRRVLEGGFADD